MLILVTAEHYRHLRLHHNLKAWLQVADWNKAVPVRIDGNPSAPAACRCTAHSRSNVHRTDCTAGEDDEWTVHKIIKININTTHYSLGVGGWQVIWCGKKDEKILETTEREREREGEGEREREGGRERSRESISQTIIINCRWIISLLYKTMMNLKTYIRAQSTQCFFYSLRQWYTTSIVAFYTDIIRHFVHLSLPDRMLGWYSPVERCFLARDSWTARAAHYKELRFAGTNSKCIHSTNATHSRELKKYKKQLSEIVWQIHDQEPTWTMTEQANPAYKIFW